MKICLASSAGGHLTELMQLEEAFEGYDRFVITFRRPDTENLNEKIYFVEDPKRNPLRLIKNIVQTLRILVRERPDVIITTGAGVVVPACYFGKLMGARVIYIESYARINAKSFSGSLIYPIADLFFVQWRSMLRRYGEKASYGGCVV